MSFESPKTGKKIPSSFSSPEFAGPGVHEVSVMSNDSTMDSIATNVSSSMTESKIIKSVNSNTHDSGFGDSAHEDTSVISKKHGVLVARAEHSITLSNQPDQPDITLMTRIENKEKSKLKSVEEDIDVKQANDEVITIVKTTKMTTKVEKVKKKKRKNSKKLDKMASQESNAESVDDSNQNQSESLVYQVDINKSTEELVYQTMNNKKSDELSTSETKPSIEPALDLNSTVLDCEEILSNYSASNANHPSSPRHDKDDKDDKGPEQVVTNALASETIVTNGFTNGITNSEANGAPSSLQEVPKQQEAKKKGFFNLRFRSRDKESNAKRKLDPKTDPPASPSKHFKPTCKQYNLEKYQLLSIDEKERLLYMKKECVDLIIEKLDHLIDQERTNAHVFSEMVSRSLDLLRHDRIESFDKLAEELDREYNVANVVIHDDANEMQSVFSKQMEKLILEEKILLNVQVDKSRRPCEEVIEFESGKAECGANLNSINQNLININKKENELLEQANQNEMDEQVKEKCPTPPSTPQNELGSGDGTVPIKQVPPVVSAADLNKEILTKVNESAANETSVQTTPSQNVNRKPKRKSTLSSCFTCAGVLKLSDDESRPKEQQQKDKKKVVVPKPNEQEVPNKSNIAADTIVQTTLVTHDLDQKPLDANTIEPEKISEQNEEKFIALDTDDSVSEKQKSEEGVQLNVEQANLETNEEVKEEIMCEDVKNESADGKADSIEDTVMEDEKKEEPIVQEMQDTKIDNEMPAKKSKNKKKKKKKKNKSEKRESVDKGQTNSDEKETNEENKHLNDQGSTQEDENEQKMDQEEQKDEPKVDEPVVAEIETKVESDQVVPDVESDNLAKELDIQVELESQKENRIHVMETLREITERVVQESVKVNEARSELKELDIKQEIGIDHELKVESEAEMHKLVAVQQNDPVVLPEPREKVISLAVEDLTHHVPASTEPVAVKEPESEDDSSNVSCFSCRGKKAAKKAKGPKTPKQPILTEPAVGETSHVNQIIEPRSVDANLFVGLDSTDQKKEVDQNVNVEEVEDKPVLDKHEHELPELPITKPSLIGSTSIEQQTHEIEPEPNEENNINIHREKDIVVELIYEASQDIKNESDEKLENKEENIFQDDIVEKNLIEKELLSEPETNVDQPFKLELENVNEDQQVMIVSEKANLSDDPVVLPDPSDRPVTQIVEATPVIEPVQPIEQKAQPSSKKSSFACCGGKKSNKKKKTKKTSKIDLPIVNILAPKQEKIPDTIKKVEEPKPEPNVESVKVNDLHDLPRVEKAPPKDWAKGLDRTQSTELIRRDPVLCDIKITDNLDQQLTNLTIELPYNVDVNEVKVTKSESVKVSELELTESSKQYSQTVEDKPADSGEQTEQEEEVKAQVDDSNVQVLESNDQKDKTSIVEDNSEVQNDDKVKSNEGTTIDQSLNIQTSLTIDSPGAVIKIEREPDHAFIPDLTKERINESVVDQTVPQESTKIVHTSSSTKISNGKTKKSKRTSRIDLPLINILVPKHKSPASKAVETKNVSDTVHLEQNVTKVVNLGNDLDKPIQLVEKDTEVDVTIPSEVELKKINIDLKLDTIEGKQTPEIDINISQFTDQAKNDDNFENNETKAETKSSEEKYIKEEAETSKLTEQATDLEVGIEKERQELPTEEVTEANKVDIEKEKQESANEDAKEEDKVDVENEKQELAGEQVTEVDKVTPATANFVVPDIKKLDHEPDVVVLPEVDLSARSKEIQEVESKPLEQIEPKPIESKKEKSKKKSTSKFDLPLIDLFVVKEAKKESHKNESNVYVDMPVIDLVRSTEIGQKKRTKEPVSCFACKSKKSKKAKKKSQPEPVAKPIPEIIEPNENDQEIRDVDKAIELLDQNINQASLSDTNKIINEAEQNDEINVTPLIVNEEIKENDQTEQDICHEEKSQSKAVTEEVENIQRKSEDEKMDQEEQNVDNVETVDEQKDEPKVDEPVVAEIETKVESDQVVPDVESDNLAKELDIQVELESQKENRIHVMETLREITERVVQESVKVNEARSELKELDIKQEIGIDHELKVESEAEMHKLVAVQQNDPVVLPEPREKVISLAVEDSTHHVPASTEPVAVKEPESEDDSSNVSCFSCRGKKAAKKAKGPKQPVKKPVEPMPESLSPEINLTPQIKSVNLDLFKGLDKPSSLSEMEKAIDYSDLSVVPQATIVEKQTDDTPEQKPQVIEIELVSDLTSVVDLPPLSPTKAQVEQVKSEIEQIIEPAPIPEFNAQVPTIKIEQAVDSFNSPPVDLTTPPKKPPRGHMDTTLLNECEQLLDQDNKMNVKQALIEVNSPEEKFKSDEAKTKRGKKYKTSIIDLPLIDILVPKESKSSKSDHETKISDNLPKELHIEPKGTSIELNQPQVELFIEKPDSFNTKMDTINLSIEDKKLLKAKRNEICEYLKQRSGYKLELLIEATSKTTSKKELKAKEKLADKLYKRSIKLMTKTRVNPLSFTELSKKLEKIVSVKSGAADIEKCVGQIRTELENETLFSCLREKSDNKIEKIEENVEQSVEPDVKSEETKVELAESRKSSINSEILLRCPNLSWREANERARILFYKGQIPSIHYNEKRDSFHVSRLVNASGKEKMSQVPVTDDDVKKLLNSCGLYWNGESIDILDKSDEIFKNAQQEAFDILNSIQMSDTVQKNENHCETVEQSKINYIY